MIEDREDFIALLKDVSYRRGEFTLSSGKKSEHYINCKPAILRGDALLFISWSILECLEEDTIAVGGLTLGADPLVSGVAMASACVGDNVSGLIVRKEPKGHGTAAWIEGPLLPKGSKVSVLEDVITTGGSAIKAAEKLRDAGYIVERVVAIVDRQEGYDVLEAAGLDLVALFTLEELT